MYLVEEKGFSIVVSGTCLFWFEMGGVVGGTMAGICKSLSP